MASLRNLVRNAACLIFLLSTAVATPVSIVEVKDAFSRALLSRETVRISQVKNPAYSAFGPAAYAKAFQKYNAAVPEELISAITVFPSTPAINGMS
jgi:hypothetical protein